MYTANSRATTKIYIRSIIEEMELHEILSIRENTERAKGKMNFKSTRARTEKLQKKIHIKSNYSNNRFKCKWLKHQLKDRDY